jgi:hypothetical protein
VGQRVKARWLDRIRLGGFSVAGVSARDGRGGSARGIGPAWR